MKAFQLASLLTRSLPVFQNATYTFDGFFANIFITNEMQKVGAIHLFIFLFVLLIISAAGQCYRHPGKTKKEMQEDLSECQSEATEAAKSTRTKRAMNTYDRVSLINQCMLMRGYIWH